MQQPWPHRYQLWLRVSFVIIFGGLCFLGVQFADLWGLQSFAPEGNGLRAVGLEPVAYVPVSRQALSGSNGAGASFGGLAPPEIKIAEVGDGGDLGRRARRRLESYRPYVLAQAKDDVAYEALGPVLDALGGELKWREGDPQASIVLPDALITLTPGQLAAERNYQPLTLPAPVLAEYGQLRVPVKVLTPLCDIQVITNREGNWSKLTRGDRKLYVIVRERMYSMEVSRSGRSLQVFFLGEPIKQYPLCVGRGNNTPVGHFVIQNKAVWPPWNAYWGEYMPGGSAASIAATRSRWPTSYCGLERCQR